MRILKAGEAIPINFKYFGDNTISINDNGEALTTFDGYTLYMSDIIDNIVDASFNKYSFFGLTPLCNITDIVQDIPLIASTQGPMALVFNSGDYYSVNIDSAYEFESIPLSSGDCILYNFENILSLSSTEYYRISYRDKVLGLNASNQIILQNYSGLDSQLFELSATSGDYFSLVSKDHRIMEYNGNDQFLLTKDGENFININNRSTTLSGYNSGNKWVRYENFYNPECGAKYSVLTVDDQNSITDVKTNYVISAPIGQLSISGSMATLPVDLIPLKNFKTISCDQYLIPTSGVSGSDAVGLRQYQRIHTGGSRTEGYPNIHLAYKSDYSRVLEFRADTYTYFHIPTDAPEISIQNAGFQNAGAFGGIVPEFSDKIYKKLSNYEDTTWWGGGSHNEVQNGTWLCAWLSGDDTGNGVWLERYYNPGIVTTQYAWGCETSGVVEQIDFVENSDPVQDIISDMTIEGGAYYKYYHVGPEQLSKLLETLKGVDNVAILKFDNFTAGDIINDETENNNDGMVLNYDYASEALLDIGYGTDKNSAILFNQKSEIMVESSDSLDVSGDLSISMWVYNKDWVNGRSTSIFNHYFKSGYKIEFINHGLYYSYMFPNATSGNEQFHIIPCDIESPDDMITIRDIDGIPTSIAVDSDNYLWAITYNTENSESKLFKFSPAGTVLESITIDDIHMAQIMIASESIGYLKTVDGDVYSMNLATCDISLSGSIPSGDYLYTSITSDMENNAVLHEEADCLDIFLDGTVCKILNGELYIGGIKKFNISDYEYEHVCCDESNYYFVTLKQVSESGNSIKLYKFNRDDDTIFDAYTLNDVTNAVNSTFLCKEAVNGQLETVLYWVRQNDIAKYYINSFGRLEELSTIAIGSSMGGYVDGDYSGYKFNKRCHYAYGHENSYIKASIMVRDNIVEKLTLAYDTSTMSDNWHLVSYIKDNSRNQLALYMDENLVSSSFLNSNAYSLYFTGAALSIGGAIDGSNSLFDALNVSNRRLDGGISQTAIYNRYLDSDEIFGLYFSKINTGNAMRWAINTGSKNYIEDLQYLFKFKKPGIKSQYFNLVVKNMNVDEDSRELYESYIRSNIAGILPANMKLVDIIWR